MIHIISQSNYRLFVYIFPLLPDSTLFCRHFFSFIKQFCYYFGVLLEYWCQIMYPPCSNRFLYLVPATVAAIPRFPVEYVSAYTLKRILRTSILVIIKRVHSCLLFSLWLPSLLSVLITCLMIHTRAKLISGLIVPLWAS